MKHARTVLATALSLVFAAAVMPQPAHADSKAELQQRFKERYPELQQLRKSGKLGETSTGTAEAVNGVALEKAAQKIVDAENADRAELYQVLAKEIGTTAEKVGRINGTRRIKELPSGEYYKDDEGKWHKKGG